MRNPQFKNYLNENINLITILGIFNGLSIYSSTLEDSNGKYLLGFVFTLISIFILRELILNIPEKEDLHLPIITFMLGLSSVWIFLVYLLFKNYTTVTNIIFSLSTILLSLYLAVEISNSKYLKGFREKYPKWYGILNILIIVSAFVIGLFVFYYSLEIIQSLFGEIPKKKIKY